MKFESAETYSSKDEDKDSDLEQATDYLIHRYKNIDILKEKFFKDPEFTDLEKEKLIVTDLFVEKDIQILTRRAKGHFKKGNIYFYITVILLIFGVSIALFQMYNQFINPEVSILEWSQIFQLFIKPFTAYGLLVFTAIALWRQSKAELDQAQRIYEKRRANRILRTFVYLHGGNINIDEIERILKWGTIDSNAFTNIKAEGKSPVGAITSDAVKQTSEIVKNGSKSVNNSGKNNV